MMANFEKIQYDTDYQCRYRWYWYQTGTRYWYRSQSILYYLSDFDN